MAILVFHDGAASVAIQVSHKICHKDRSLTRLLSRVVCVMRVNDKRIDIICIHPAIKHTHCSPSCL